MMLFRVAAFAPEQWREEKEMEKEKMKVEVEEETKMEIAAHPLTFALLSKAPKTALFRSTTPVPIGRLLLPIVFEYHSLFSLTEARAFSTSAKNRANRLLSSSISLLWFSLHFTPL